ncbi:MAG: hypothetical protein ACTS1X_03570 [Parasphingopyxis sp.]|uniref:hypothetical protein n=1 Tax=Parasphingopyxis sp. TaxID=1920299 RepID=UPI003FA14E8D
MRYSALIAALVFILMPGKALADCSGVFCNDVTIDRLFVSGTGDIALRTSGDETQLDCDPGSSLYLRFATTVSAYSEWYAMVLTAYVQQAPITFRMVGGTGECTINYMFQEQ